MLKRTMTSLFIAACICLVVVAGGALAQAGNDPVLIHPLRWDSSQVIYSDQPVTFIMGWGTCHKGLLKPYLLAVNMDFILDGVSLFASKAATNQYWGAARQAPAGPGAVACKGKTPETIWRVDWSYDYGTLAPGTHTLIFSHAVDHPVTDGGDYNGDGKPDIFRDMFNQRTITIVVEERP